MLKQNMTWTVVLSSRSPSHRHFLLFNVFFSAPITNGLLSSTPLSLLSLMARFSSAPHHEYHPRHRVSAHLLTIDASSACYVCVTIVKLCLLQPKTLCQRSHHAVQPPQHPSLGTHLQPTPPLDEKCPLPTKPVAISMPTTSKSKSEYLAMYLGTLDKLITL
ncbi:hypothetical protein EDD36DRAFT_322148 [Exophiala viscosa]|uniref:Uncharacterized protein n=1 Tax=Exophiala viscosa TaxID=2486360 RepID=A0AAN6IAX9_9EURO|nr:hypothetical protein EDD36DRAFT_322148 [Exophiala viscosa]